MRSIYLRQSAQKECPQGSLTGLVHSPRQMPHSFMITSTATENKHQAWDNIPTNSSVHQELRDKIPNNSMADAFHDSGEADSDGRLLLSPERICPTGLPASASLRPGTWILIVQTFSGSNVRPDA
ncbi:hypothetical protein THAOC_21789 [Thalassiosira oceanica]|uniref:Uncharacterized protein n=1 Tax=Thalassiosira oceanica TaxID=159749 RepID=K0SAZ5_THAOC|nr:hypothetical protein THAOC_21789 [Thalassiosira oceanica]|eukprot:EJK58111.1 hypothetical protein THAOC_21789 [Thalassiosira oceanica]